MATKKNSRKLTKSTKIAHKTTTPKTQPQIEYEYTDEENVLGFDETPPMDMTFALNAMLYREMDGTLWEENEQSGNEAIDFALLNTSMWKRDSIPLELRASMRNPYPYDRYLARIKIAGLKADEAKNAKKAKKN